MILKVFCMQYNYTVDLTSFFKKIFRILRTGIEIWAIFEPLKGQDFSVMFTVERLSIVHEGRNIGY